MHPPALVWPFSTLFSRYTYTMVATFDRALTQVQYIYYIIVARYRYNMFVCVCIYFHRVPPVTTTVPILYYRPREICISARPLLLNIYFLYFTYYICMLLNCISKYINIYNIII